MVSGFVFVVAVLHRCSFFFFFFFEKKKDIPKQCILITITLFNFFLVKKYSIACIPGQANDPDSTSRCIACEVGMFSKISATETCLPCPLLLVQPLTSSTGKKQK